MYVDFIMIFTVLPSGVINDYYWLQSSNTSAKSRNYPADTAKQRFMEETINKETAIRLGWHFSPTGRQLYKDSSTSRRKEVKHKELRLMRTHCNYRILQDVLAVNK